MTPLALVLSALLALPTGQLPRHVRNLGGATYVAHVATWIESAAHDEGIAPAYLAALLLAESGLDANAVSSIGARGLGQLNVRTPLGREWLAACRLVNDADDCAALNVAVAARALKAALVRCRGDRLAAIVRYRHGHAAKARPRDRYVLGLARTIAWRMKSLQTPTAWRGGVL